MQAIVKPELASKFLDAHERCEKEDPGRDLTGREMIWMLFDYLKQASNRHSYTDYEDLASVKLHGKRLGKFWESWKFVLRSITKKPAKDVLEYLVWTQIKDCELIKDECAIYSRKTKRPEEEVVRRSEDDHRLLS